MKNFFTLRRGMRAATLLLLALLALGQAQAQTYFSGQAYKRNPFWNLSGRKVSMVGQNATGSDFAPATSIAVSSSLAPSKGAFNHFWTPRGDRAISAQADSNCNLTIRIDSASHMDSVHTGYNLLVDSICVRDLIILPAPDSVDGCNVLNVYGIGHRPSQTAWKFFVIRIRNTPGATYVMSTQFLSTTIAGGPLAAWVFPDGSTSVFTVGQIANPTCGIWRLDAPRTGGFTVTQVGTSISASSYAHFDVAELDIEPTGRYLAWTESYNAHPTVNVWQIDLPNPATGIGAIPAANNALAYYTTSILTSIASTRANGIEFWPTRTGTNDYVYASVGDGTLSTHGIYSFPITYKSSGAVTFAVGAGVYQTGTQNCATSHIETGYDNLVRAYSINATPSLSQLQAYSSSTTGTLTPANSLTLTPPTITAYGFSRPYVPCQAKNYHYLFSGYIYGTPSFRGCANQKITYWIAKLVKNNAAGINTVSYQWYKNGAVLSGAIQNYYSFSTASPSGTTTYGAHSQVLFGSCVYTNEPRPARAFAFTYDPSLCRIGAIEPPSGFSVYPNPASEGVLHITPGTGGISRVQVYSADGKELAVTLAHAETESLLILPAHFKGMALIRINLLASDGTTSLVQRSIIVN